MDQFATGISEQVRTPFRQTPTPFNLHRSEDHALQAAWSVCHSKYPVVGHRVLDFWYAVWYGAQGCCCSSLPDRSRRRTCVYFSDLQVMHKDYTMEQWTQHVRSVFRMAGVVSPSLFMLFIGLVRPSPMHPLVLQIMIGVLFCHESLPVDGVAELFEQKSDELN